MFGFKKSPLTKITKHNSADPGFSASSGTNPFDSDTESDSNQTLKPAKRTSSEPALTTPNLKASLFDEDGGNGASSASSSYSRTSGQRNKYKNDFRDSGGLENQSVEELENYAVYKAEETTDTVNGCLKIAENIREDASNTLMTLHKQGEQIRRTHETATDIDQHLSRGEKLLGSLGGMFSKTWKPKKIRTIGPVLSRDDSFKRRSSHMEQREKLGLAPISKGRSNSRQPLSEPTNAIQKVEVEKAKQDDALTDLSNILGELKVMAIDMGAEIEGQNEALDRVDVDIGGLNIRMKDANLRGRRLIGK